MIILNQFKAYPCFTDIQREQNSNKQNMPRLKQLNADTLSFNGWFSSKPVGPKHVTIDAYELVTKYIEKNSGDDSARKAVQFMKKIKAICEEGLQLNLDENAEFTAKLVEKARVEEVGTVLTKVKSSVLSSSIYEGSMKQSMDYYKSILGKLSN